MSNTARRQSVSYPNGRVVNLGYGSTGSVDDLFSLVKSTAISGESGNKVEYTRAGLGRYVKIAYPQPGVKMSMIRPGGGSEGDSGDPYDGYDRFSRVQEMRWQGITSGTPIDAWQWGFNEASSRTWKKNLVAVSGQDEAYGYDGLYQVIRDAVGTLNTNRTAIGGVPGEEEDFTYDPTGNWLGYRRSDDGSVVLDQSRSNNQDNQLTQIDGDSALLAYDRAGNATKTAPGTGGDWSKCYQPVWDAWNRLVEVKDETGASVQKNATWPKPGNECPAMSGFFRHCVNACHATRAGYPFLGPISTPLLVEAFALTAGNDWTETGSDSSHHSDLEANNSGILNALNAFQSCVDSCRSDWDQQRMDLCCPPDWTKDRKL